MRTKLDASLAELMQSYSPSDVLTSFFFICKTTKRIHNSIVLSNLESGIKDYVDKLELYSKLNENPFVKVLDKIGVNISDVDNHSQIFDIRLSYKNKTYYGFGDTLLEALWDAANQFPKFLKQRVRYA